MSRRPSIVLCCFVSMASSLSYGMSLFPTSEQRDSIKEERLQLESNQQLSEDACHHAGMRYDDLLKDDHCPYARLGRTPLGAAIVAEDNKRVRQLVKTMAREGQMQIPDREKYSRLAWHVLDIGSQQMRLQATQSGRCDPALYIECDCRYVRMLRIIGQIEHGGMPSRRCFSFCRIQ